jgi:hypothetical protein
MSRILHLVLRTVLTLLLGAVAFPASLSDAFAQGVVAVPSAEPSEADTGSDADTLVDWLAHPWTGDLDGILERGFLRIDTGYNPVMFCHSGADQRGFVVDIANELQKAFR